MTTPIWMIGAPCAGHQDLFFDETSKTKVRKARSICNSCAVQSKCLEFAMKSNDVGIWAGTTANQRAKMRRALRKSGRIRQEPKLTTDSM